MAVNSNRFKEALLASIREGLAEALGRDTARAVEFYAEPSIAASDIEAYNRTLRKIFGDGASVLEQICAEKLFARLAIPFEKKEGHTLAQYVWEAATRAGLRA